MSCNYCFYDVVYLHSAGNGDGKFGHTPNAEKHVQLQHCHRGDVHGVSDLVKGVGAV